LATELVNPKLREVSLFLFADVRIVCHGFDCRIDIGGKVVMELFVDA
jgi:hypothetical protein